MQTAAMSASVPATTRLPVMVGVDGVRGRLATVELAAAEARRRQVPLTIVHVWPGRYAGPFRSRGVVPTEQDGRRVLDIAQQRVHRVDADIQVATRLIDGDSANTLVRCTADAQLLVVGHRDDVLSRSGWGSTTAYLAHHAACPLLVDRGEGRRTGPVVLAASARGSATETVACAFEQAELRRAPLVAVHVCTVADQPGLTPTVAGYAKARDEADRNLAAALAEWRERFPEVTVSRLVLHDLDVAYTLERASCRGQLFVAGAGRHGRFAELLYGSRDLTMLRTTACPVLLVPPSWRGAAGRSAPEPTEQRSGGGTG
ncbi:MAG TPA: universal stress protein [Actinoplanes sp.]|nr:universal stress protein [Actinoplanes sp.]